MLFLDFLGQYISVFRCQSAFAHNLLVNYGIQKSFLTKKLFVVLIVYGREYSLKSASSFKLILRVPDGVLCLTSILFKLGFSLFFFAGIFFFLVENLLVDVGRTYLTLVDLNTLF